MPTDTAPSRSDCSAIRFRSRQVICMIGSMPTSRAAIADAQLDIRTCAPWLSVRFTASTQPSSSRARSFIASADAPRTGDSSEVMVNFRAASRSRSDSLMRRSPARPRTRTHSSHVSHHRRGRHAVVLCPQVIIAPGPVVQPGALAEPPVVYRPLQPPQVVGVAGAGGPLVPDDPHAAPVRVYLAGPARADPAARTVAQLLGAAHGARVAGDRQRALPAHPAAEQVLLGLALGGGEEPAGQWPALHRRADLPVEPAGLHDLLHAVSPARR